MPGINGLRDSGADAAFSRVHRLSVLINQVQFLISVAVLIRVALPV